MISVLICTWNRGALINDTLKSLIEDSKVKADEIIVVNGGGKNDCNNILEYWKSRCTYLHVVNTVNINLANSRNVGIKACKGDIVLMTDDDARVFPDWIEQMSIAHAKYPDAGVIGGAIIDASGNTFLSNVADLTTFPRYSAIQQVRTVPGVNCSYKRSVLDKIGDQDIQMFRGEDVDYNWRATKAGFKVLYIPEIKVYHAHRPTWRGLFNQHHMYGRAYYRVRKKWPDMYCAYPHRFDSVRMWLKGGYYLITPWIYAFQKAKQMNTTWKTIQAFPVVLGMSYYTMYGTFKQAWKDRTH
jgi:GT2 family glycosyltransferase